MRCYVSPAWRKKWNFPKEELGEPTDENIPSSSIFWINTRENRKKPEYSEGNIEKNGCAEEPVHV